MRYRSTPDLDRRAMVLDQLLVVGAIRTCHVNDGAFCRSMVQATFRHPPYPQQEASKQTASRRM